MGRLVNKKELDAEITASKARLEKMFEQSKVFHELDDAITQRYNRPGAIVQTDAGDYYKRLSFTNSYESHWKKLSKFSVWWYKKTGRLN